jgi:hypothetical protein
MHRRVFMTDPLYTRSSGSAGSAKLSKSLGTFMALAMVTSPYLHHSHHV